MIKEIITLTLSMPFNLGTVNCYLVKTDTGFFLIDTGVENKRAELEAKLVSAGCQPGNLKLILITHGDFDHIANAAYLRNKFNSKIAMHADDFGMSEQGDMFSSRKQPNIIIRSLAPLIIRLKQADRFTPDITLTDGDELSQFGFDARVLSIPGHSKGSIGILTPNGDLFCGDLLANIEQPELSSLMDDIPTAYASIDKLKGYDIQTIYPGHGKPFQMEDFLTSGA